MRPPSLPADRTDPPSGTPDERVDPPGDAPAPDDPPHILVAEDELHIGRMLATLLEDASMRVTVVTDGVAALDRLRSDGSISLVILDLMMPGMGGLDVLRELRESHGEEPALPVIVLTGKGQTEVRQQALDLGATELFIKPFSPRKLVDRVAELGGR